MTAFDQRPDRHEWITAACFEDAGESGADVGWKRTALVLFESCFAEAAVSSGDAGIFDWCSAPPTRASMRV